MCVRLCRCSSSERVKRFPHSTQVQMKGLSPVCHRRCARRCEVFPYTFPQPGTWQMCCFFFPGSPELLREGKGLKPKGIGLGGGHRDGIGEFGVRFSQTQSQVLSLGHNSPTGHCRHGELGLESWERTWGCPGGHVDVALGDTGGLTRAGGT